MSYNSKESAVRGFLFLLACLIPLFLQSQNNLSDIRRHELIVKTIFPEESYNENGKDHIWKGSDIELGPGGNLYISDSRANNIHVFGASGNWLFNFGRHGQGPGEFISPDSISAGQKLICIQDLGNFRVQGFSPDGKYQNQIKLFQTCSGFVIGNDHFFRASRIYASVSQDPAIMVFDSLGKIVNSFGKPLDNKADFHVLNLASMALDKNDNLYLAYLYWPIIRKYSSSGKLVREIAPAFKFIDKYRKDNEKAFGTSRYWAILTDIKCSDSRVYVMSLDKNVIRILEYDEDLNTRQIYEVDFQKINEDVIIRHFAVGTTSGELCFYLLEASRLRNQVYVLTPK